MSFSSTHEVTIWIVGEGCRMVDVTSDMSLETLMSQEGLKGFGVTINDSDIPRNDWGSYKLNNVTEIWASQGVKGA